MSEKQTHVYASCSAGRRRYLQTMFSGTRKECNAFVEARAKNGQGTHYLSVSSLDRRAATRKFCDGATWDEANCCYLD